MTTITVHVNKKKNKVAKKRNYALYGAHITLVVVQKCQGFVRLPYTV